MELALRNAPLEQIIERGKAAVASLRQVSSSFYEAQACGPGRWPGPTSG